MSAKCSHTPGPWKTDPAFDNECVMGADDILVADCAIFVNPACGSRDAAINEANARLVAAAPELLSAAKRVLSHLNERIDQAPSSAKPVFDGIADLHDAIAKAEGRS